MTVQQPKLWSRHAAYLQKKERERELIEDFRSFLSLSNDISSLRVKGISYKSLGVISCVFFII